MSLELVGEPIRINRTISEDSTQTIVENDIIVPDTKPDIAQILLLDGEAWVSGAEAAPDRVLVSGSVRYKILYIPDDPEQSVKSITSVSSFQYAMEMPDTRQGMQCRVKCDIEHLEYEILNSRKINVKAIVSLSAKVTEEVGQYVTRDLTGSDGIQVLRNRAAANTYLGDQRTDCRISETLDIPVGKPAILEILRNDVRITGREYRAGDDKVAVRGNLNISTLYIADNESRSIQFMEHEIPFTRMLDMPGIDENCSTSIDITIGETNFSAEEDGDGELRRMNCDVALDIYAHCYGRKEIELVEDAYSPYSKVSLEREELLLDELVSENVSQLTLRENIEVDEIAPDISELFNILGKLSLSAGEITDDRVVVEGVAVCNVLYLASDEGQPVYCAEREIPFRHAIEVKGAREGMDLDVEMDIDHFSYSIVNSREVEVRLAVGIKTRVARKVSVPVIVKAQEEPFDEKRAAQQPSIILYFTQPGDTLWKIAKRYYTTIDDILENNDLSETEQIAPGSRIIITRKL
ncbi:MAG: DUF3794 domain-containing protein [Clostridiaceae bacterium]|mgnify:FL=1|jgi:hypothetical protein|nr:DUF3794 domain-containing protein [Clostridiaceae bacterium]